MTERVFARRALARTIDGLLFVVLFFLIADRVAAADPGNPDGTGTMIAAYGYTCLACTVYEIVLVGLLGATLGKLITGIRVVQLDGTRCGLWRGLRRALLPIFLLWTLLVWLYPVVYLAAFAFREGRGPVDRLAGTTVVRRRATALAVGGPVPA